MLCFDGGTLERKMLCNNLEANHKKIKTYALGFRSGLSHSPGIASEEVCLAAPARDVGLASGVGVCHAAGSD